MSNKLLEVKNLSIGFDDTGKTQLVVDDISFHVEQGEILGIVGESGSGKSMTALTIMDLQKNTASVKTGEIMIEGNNVLAMKENQRLAYLGSQMGMVFQEPMTSLNPVLKIGAQVDEMLTLHTDLSKKEKRERTIQALLDVGLKNPEEVYEQYPHELSGGMRQRVMIAMAMMNKPKLLIADEPTTALDVSVQTQILELLKKMNKEYGVSIILISHDLGVIRHMCQRTIVMADGKIVEQGFVKDIFEHPQQEYTRILLDAVPSIQRERMVTSDSNIMKTNKMLTVQDVDIFYYQNGKIQRTGKKQIVKHASFDIMCGEVIGIVGESGSGKSTLAKAIVGLNRLYEGKIDCKEKKPQMVFQDPYSSLNQSKCIAWILEEPLRIQGGYTKQERKQLVKEKLLEVGLTEEVGKRYVSQLSGGQRQRVCIAAALMLQSKFIVLDEAVSALDVTIQRQILNLLIDLKKKHNLTYLFISHDMNVIYEICDRVLVMYQGEIVEQGETKEVFKNPKQEYTKKLINAVLK